MIEGDIRREKIIEIMSNQKEPVSGSDLAKKFGVSRQVIVQDIALLRATNKNILSTNKGYFLYNPGKGPQKPKRSFCVQHTTEQMQDELYTIVDYGGKVLDAVVEHDIYGQITVDLMLCNRMDVDEFMEKLPDALRPGGRVAILTFHSGEDKLVKKALKAGYKEGIYSDYAKDVIRPSAKECTQNPRARSTKMRWAIKAK